MNVPKHPSQIRRMVQSRVNKMQAKGPVLAASLVQIAKTCGNANCRCQSGQKHVGNYLTFKEAGKTRTVYVPVDMVEEVRGWVQEHQRLKELDKEISELSVALIRSHVSEKRRKKGRS